MALLLHLRSRAKSNTVSNSSLRHHLFCTSNSGGGGDGDGDRDPPTSNSPFSSYFRDVKDRLKQPSPSRSTPKLSDTRSSSFSFPASSKSQPSSLDEIQKNLSEFRRRRTSVPPPGDPSSAPQQQISFQEIYKRGQIQGESAGNAANVGTAKPGGGGVSFDAIRESLRQIGAGAGGRKGMTGLKDALNLKPSGSTVIGGSGSLPDSVFGREMREKREGDGFTAATKTEFAKMYNYGELGEKLRKLRPEGKGKEWFSLRELNERLMRLREMEKKEAESNVKRFSVEDVRQVLTEMSEADEKKKKKSLQRIDFLGQLGGTPAFLLEPPKEHLVEKYFHPDNMSSAEKLKIELAKVRDEFKMSESDCGSARVQVAQLTTKIKHLSSVLHKKDVHSRKGLVAMVQRRKRLLKYLRRTDWESYCFVISKLGLRDNPDYTYKGRSAQATSS
ncbi:uncharacterized protein LOC133286663 [Gastrolobium bilobum]|uniref:uncharacterized protein LOC133286663 n=1 Tax=Gastrolobium bilobum TaxID=150636 RepID=UPI002AB1593B|nr:uncharacterized protein LOC133286663 [Gastrolobium bilobum]